MKVDWIKGVACEKAVALLAGGYQLYEVGNNHVELYTPSKPGKSIGSFPFSNRHLYSNNYLGGKIHFCGGQTLAKAIADNCFEGTLSKGLFVFFNIVI